MREKLKVIIVDDERIIREWIAMIIEKHSDDYIVLDTGGSSKKAIEMCVQEQVDIVITDIKMKPMDGLELIREIQKISQNIYFIIVSNYDDFAYAKQGLKLGITDYLLKGEITDEQLMNCLEDIRSQIEEKGNNNFFEAELEEQILIRQNYWHQIFKEKENTDEILAKLGSALTNDNLFMIIFSADQMEKMPYDEQVSIVKIIQKRIMTRFSCNEIFVHEDGNIVVLLNVIYDGTKSSLEQLYTLASLIINDVGSKGRSISCVITIPFSSLKESCKIYQEYQEYFLYRFYSEGGKIITNSALQNKWDKIDSKRKLSMEYLSSILYRRDYAQVYHCLREQGEELMKNHKTSPEAVREWYQKLFLLLLHYFSDYKQEKFIEKASSVMEIIMRAPLFRDILEAIYGFYESAVQEIANMDIMQDVVNEVIDYITHHYEEKITLASMAEKVYLSENYLGKIFKRRTGENFNSYLTELRINIAKQKLKNPNMKIYQIAEDIGFQNVGYFTQVFKKVTGSSPKEYRQSIAEHDFEL